MRADPGERDNLYKADRTSDTEKIIDLLKLDLVEFLKREFVEHCDHEHVQRMQETHKGVIFFRIYF